MTTEELEAIKKSGVLQRLELAITEALKLGSMRLHRQCEHVPWHTEADLDAMFASLREVESDVRTLYAELTKLDETLANRRIELFGTPAKGDRL